MSETPSRLTDGLMLNRILEFTAPKDPSGAFRSGADVGGLSLNSISGEVGRQQKHRPAAEREFYCV